MIGKTLAHYQVTERIGAGGMGEVYRARDTKLDRDVALKVLPEYFASDAERLARFEREDIARWIESGLCARRQSLRTGVRPTRAQKTGYTRRNRSVLVA